MEAILLSITPPVVKQQFKVGEPANPAIARCLNSVKTDINVLKDLYMKVAGTCTKSADTMMELDIDVSIYLTHLGSTQPTSSDDFVDEDTMKTWFISEIMALELLCKTPNLSSLRKPSGKNAWDSHDSTRYDKVKGQLQKDWIKLRKMLDAPVRLSQLPEDIKIKFASIEHSRFHSCYTLK